MSNYHRIETKLDSSFGIHVTYVVAGEAHKVVLPFPPSKILEGRAHDKVVLVAVARGHRPGKAFVRELRAALVQCELDWPSDRAEILEGSYYFGKTVA
jgi:hypothetical protein